MAEKFEALLERLKACGSLVVALSGGVDSSVLSKAAAIALGDKAVAMTARSELLSYDELADAKAMARAAGIRHVLVDAHDLDNPDIVRNDKALLLLQVRAVSKDGRMGEGKRLCLRRRREQSRRPGGFPPRHESDCRAFADGHFSVHGLWMDKGGHPRAGAGVGACRRGQAQRGLSRLTCGVWPAADGGEARAGGGGGKIGPSLRVRHHDNLARIEAEPDAFAAVMAHREEIVEKLKALGFLYVTLDLGGYRMGSTNEALSKRRGAF